MTKLKIIKINLLILEILFFPDFVRGFANYGY